MSYYDLSVAKGSDFRLYGQTPGGVKYDWRNLQIFFRSVFLKILLPHLFLLHSDFPGLNFGQSRVVSEGEY